MFFIGITGALLGIVIYKKDFCIPQEVMMVSEKKLRILIVDDHPIMRRGLQMILKGQKDMDVVGEAGSGADAVAMVKQLLPDLVILDLSLPDGNGIMVIQDIKCHYPEAKVIVLTIHEEEEYVHKVVAEGAHGYLLKNAADDEMIMAIRAVARGEMVLDPSLTRDFFQRVIRPISERGKNVNALSSRQKEILAMIAQGYTDKQISEKIHVSIKTVESHKARIKEKLNIGHRSELVQYAIQNDLVGPLLSIKK